MTSDIKFTVTAPAKLNLHLAVLDKRPDGFHNLESVFFALDFGDILHFQLLKDKKTLKLTMVGAGFDLPAEKNIVFKALSLFREKTGFDQGLKVRIEKRIPIGGGLGGGSSDAAAAILALNRLADSPLSRGELLEAAAVLGSDVPFFIYQTGAAWVTGRGEYIEPLQAPAWFFVLVNPGFPSDTAAAFKLLDEFRAGQGTGDREQGAACRGSLALRQSLEIKNKGQEIVVSYLSDSMTIKDSKQHSLSPVNDFLPVFREPEKPVYNSIIFKLQELGADFASLSGAGSTCFGVFKDKAAAEKAASSLRADGSWKFVECCKCAF